MPVDTKGVEFEAFAERWMRCNDCYEGSDTVKAAGDKYLPQLGSHKRDASGELYNAYKKRALFYNAFGRTCVGLAGTLFQRPLEAKLPSDMMEDAKDITLAGETLDLFALNVTRRIFNTGRCGVLVDMATQPNGPPRPYWTFWPEHNIVNWRTDRIGGDEILTRVVLLEPVSAPDPEDRFATIIKVHYRVLELTPQGYIVTIWEERKKKGRTKEKEWVIVETITPTRRSERLSFIPFLFFGSLTNRAVVEKPPLEDLAILNLSHYLTMADLEHGLHYTALPTPWVAGKISDKQGPLVLGSQVAWIIENGGTAGMLEFSGAGLASLRDADKEKRAMMATLGARLLEDVGFQETATAVIVRHGGENATIRTIAGVVEQGIGACLRWHEWWRGTKKGPMESTSTAAVNKDFLDENVDTEKVRTALLMLQAEQISYDTFYSMLVRGRWTRPGVTSEQERETIRRQVPVNPPEPEDDEDEGGDDA